MGHTPADTDTVCSPIVYAWFLKNVMGIDAEAVVGSELNKETKTALSEFGVQAPTLISEVNSEDKVVLLDTTNPKELIAGTAEAEIIEVIDHHKLGGLSTDKPLNVTIRPYGCVATVVYERMQSESKNADKALELPKEMAGLLAAAIISDTLNQTSPTTTDLDKQVLSELANIAGVNVDELAGKMFAAKSDISDMSAAEVLAMDYKDFDFGGQNFRISSIETTEPKFTLDRLEEFRTTAEELKTQDNLAGVYAFVVDILKSEATLFCTAGAEEFAEKAFSAKFENGLMHLPGVVSRKKQIVPKFEAVA